MRWLAEYAMSGRRQAVLVVLIGATVPFLFWASAGVVALVALRRGGRDAALIGFWALLPAGAWLAIGNDSTPLITLLSTWILALVLRQTRSWVPVLLGLIVVGIGSVGLIQTLQPELYAQALELMRGLFDEIQKDLPADKAAELNEALGQLLAGAWGLVESLSTLFCLLLARWWQAMLYNPGGFRQEMHALRLPPLVGGSLMAVMLAGPVVSPALLGWMPVIALPLLVAGVTLVHGLVGVRGLGGSWLYAFYVTLILLAQFMAPVLVFIAFLDSLLDFRGRIRNAPPPSQGDGGGLS